MHHKITDTMHLLRAYWQWTLATILLLPLLISLGIWQWHRSVQKQQWLEQQAMFQNQPPVSIAQIGLALEGGVELQQMQHRRVAIYGNFFHAPLFFTDNKIRDGQFGFEVIAPFITWQNKQVLLLNLGWIAAPDRAIPHIDMPDYFQYLEAHIYIPEKPAFLQSIPLESRDRQIITYPDISALMQFLGKPMIYPFILRLEPGQPNALNTDWPQPPGIAPQRHIAYAFQWFALALTLCLLYLITLWRGAQSAKISAQHKTKDTGR